MPAKDSANQPDGTLTEKEYPATKQDEIPEDLVQKWQQLLDSAAEIFDVPAGLIMRIDPPHIEVFRASRTPGNPYEVGGRELMDGLYCEEVILSEEKLHVPHAQKSERWRDNLDVEEFGLVSYLGYPIAWPDGDIFGTICVLDSEERAFPNPYPELLGHFREIIETDLDRLSQQKQLEEQKIALERKSEQLEEFASVVSHDLRNPLNVAIGRTELAREEFDSEHLAAVARAHERMNELIEDLLTLARGGEVIRDTEPVDLTELAEICWTNIHSADAELRTDIARVVQADRSRLQQVLENLFRNAVEHGGETVTVTVGPLDDGFYVEDDGPGIAEDVQDNVFDAGYSTTETGTGFGLSIVEQVVEAHGWDIHVTDGADGGARFEITGVQFTPG